MHFLCRSRNYLISSATERERQQCFRELLCLDESKKTIWLSGTDLEPQKLYKAPKARARPRPGSYTVALNQKENLERTGKGFQQAKRLRFSASGFWQVMNAPTEAVRIGRKAGA